MFSFSKVYIVKWTSEWCFVWFRIGVALDERQISWVKLEGSLDMQTRMENLERFRQNRECQVLLSTIRSGGVGIDLRCAQKVYIMVRNFYI